MQFEGTRNPAYPQAVGYGQYTPPPMPNGIGANPGPLAAVADDEVEEVNDFNYNGFQVVRSEFFAHLREPSISFCQGKITINSACLKKLPQVDFAQILINRQTKSLAIRPCQESEVFSFQWCGYRQKDGKRQPRQITCKLFFMKLCSMMGWNPDYRYKVLGKLIRANDEYLFLFDLTAAEIFIREPKNDSKSAAFSKTPLYPAEWQDQFGIPFEDHQKALKVNLFQGYAIYGIKSTSKEAPEPPSYPAAQALPTPPPAASQGGDPKWLTSP